MASWTEIKDDVEKKRQRYASFHEQLRDAQGAAKLGVHVRAKISRSLAGIGLGHVPQELPGYQHELLRVYKNGTIDFINIDESIASECL